MSYGMHRLSIIMMKKRCHNIGIIERLCELILVVTVVIVNFMEVDCDWIDLL